MKETFMENKTKGPSQNVNITKKLKERIPLFKSQFKELSHLMKLGRLTLSNTSECLKERRKLSESFRKNLSKFINEKFKNPQFLWIHTIINHLPYLPPHRTEMDEDEINFLNYIGLSGFVNNKNAEKIKSLYIKSIFELDNFVGELVNLLKKNGFWENSLFLLTADHGEEFKEEGYFGHTPRSSSDRLLNVPLIIKYPDKSFINKTKMCCPVSTIDIVPTILDLLDLKEPPTLRGKSLKGLLQRGEKFKPGSRKYIFSEAWEIEDLLDRNPGTNSNRSIFTVRDGKHKLKVEIENSFKIKCLQLSDWQNEVKKDISSHYSTTIRLLKALFQHLSNEKDFSERIKTRTEKRRIREKISS